MDKGKIDFEALRRILEFAQSQLARVKLNERGGKRRLTQTEFFEHAMIQKAAFDLERWMEGEI